MNIGKLKRDCSPTILFCSIQKPKDRYSSLKKALHDVLSDVVRFRVLASRVLFEDRQQGMKGLLGNLWNFVVVVAS